MLTRKYKLVHHIRYSSSLLLRRRHQLSYLFFFVPKIVYHADISFRLSFKNVETRARNIYRSGAKPLCR